MKTPKSNSSTLFLPAAFLALASESVLRDPTLACALSTDGEAIAVLPLPAGFASRRQIPTATLPKADMYISPENGEPTDTDWNIISLDTMAGSPAYRIALNPAQLATLAAAIGAGEFIVLELSADPAAPVRVLTAGDSSYSPGTRNYPHGFLMPFEMPQGKSGLTETNPAASTRSNSPAEDKPLPPPVVLASTKRATLEIVFGGKPPVEIREALKEPDLAFRYSGERGTKRGVPPRTWYGPDNPFTREKISELLQVPIQFAA